MSLMFFRSLFPTWSFFSHLGPVPRLYYRYRTDPRNYQLNSGPSDLEWSEWIAKPSPSKTFGQILWGIFVNPMGNSELAIQGVILQLLEEKLKRQELILQTVAFQILAKYVRTLLIGIETSSYQFKILAFLSETQTQLDDVLFLSPELLGVSAESVDD